MPNAIDNFQNFYAQYRNTPAAPAQSGMAASVQPTAGNPPAYNPYASSYTPSPGRSTPQPLGTQQPVGAQPQPWNNPNYPQQPGYPQPTYPQPTAQPQPTYPAGYPQPGYPQPGYAPGMPGYQGPISQTLGAFRGVVNDKGYDEFVQKTAPVIDTAIPLITGIVGLFNKKKPEQPAATPSTATSVYVPNQQPPSQPPVYQQYPGYQQPAYPQPGYQQPAYPQPGYQQPYGGTPPFNPTGGGDWSTQVNQGIQGVAGLVNAIGGLFK